MLVTLLLVPTVLVCFAQSLTPGKKNYYLLLRFAEKKKKKFLTLVFNLCPDRSEEHCLVRSGLVQLLDSLCSLSGQRESSSSEKQTKKQKVATMAWAAFQVLANRCIEWEKVEGKLY